MKPGLDRLVLRDDMGEIGHQVFDDWHMRRWVNAHRALNLLDRLETGERIGPVDIHCTGAANPLSARAPKGECRVDLVLDLDQRV